MSMKISCIYFLSIFILAYSALANSEQDEIAQVFQQYRSALLNEDGKEALELVDSQTIRYYDDVVKDALKISRADLNRLDLYTKFMVLRLRHEFRKDQLEKMTGDSLFILSVKQGWVSKSEASNNSKLVNIKYDRHLASASLPQAPEIPAFYFMKENGKWKLALWKNFELANVAFSQMLQQSSLAETEFLVRLLENISKYRVDENIFEAPLK